MPDTRTEIVHVVTMRARPGRGQEWVDALHAVASPTHRERGCLKYALHQDEADPDLLVMVERWASEQALIDHNATPYIERVHEQALELLADHSSVTLHAIPFGDPLKGAV